jgi:RNA polymerase sigma factor (sigma-70 family)
MKPLPVTSNRPETLKTRPSLLSKVRRGEELGWSIFYELYRDLIYSAARGAGLSTEEAKDVLQDTMITVRDYIANFVPDKSRARFRTWLRSVVRSRIADHYRKKKRNPLEQRQGLRSDDASETMTSTALRIPNPTEVELDRYIDEKLEQAIVARARKAAKALVRAEDYQAYQLFAVKELSAAEVAAALGISAVTVRVRTFRVRRVIDQQIRRLVKLMNATQPPREAS